MRLKSLEISGFKSFAKKGQLEFDAPISAIVGPNGSGKSNIAESFRFVLGEQSIKSMRGKKGEDLIFNGTAASGRMNKAGVKVFFDNSDRKLPLDFDEISIERVVHRDGVNEYFLNNSSVRLKDVSGLLASANIGSSGHHIISQGEADRILNTTPKERRSMLEDALGLRVFQYKKVESEKKLVKTEENISQVQSLRREIAPHIKFLKKQVEKIERGKQLREKLKDFYNEYLKREDIYLKFTRDFLSSKIEGPKKEIGQIEEDLRIYRVQREQDGESEHQKELRKYQENLEAISRDLNETERESGQIEGQLQSLKRMQEIEKKRVETQPAQTVPYEEVLRLRVSVQEILDKAEDATDVSTLKRFVLSVKEMINNFVSEYRNVSSEERKENFVDEIKDLESNLRNHVAKVEDLRKKQESLKESMQRVQVEIEKEKVGNIEAERKIFELMTKKNELERDIATTHMNLDSLIREEEEFKRELAESCILVGREMTEYRSIDIKSMNGSIVAINEVQSEDRGVQRERRRELEKMKIKVEELGGAGSGEILKEFDEANERDVFLVQEIEDLEKSSVSLRQLIKDLEENINQRFKVGLQKINLEFQNYFNLMFGGGEASLRLVKAEKSKRKDTDIDFLGEEMNEDNEDVEEGIDIFVNLPRKKTKGLIMLSGGERALTSIALLFAISAVNPPPFIILDETDAALDEANSRKYADMIENLSKHSQLILITHNRETMSRASVIYGVTMEQGISKLLSIKFEDGVKFAK